MLGCLTALRRRGFRIPEDISLIGFTNLPAAELLNPPLSTVTQPAQEIGQLAAERLIELIERKHKSTGPSVMKLPTTLVVRESSSPLPKLVG